ncbi:GPI inositol-deacylase-like [Ptychodera flava]|uniref:GPI inositol-deacylase-like n=1 Tax=Ptychodera flava TaxID=63121 RepID=UPI003969CD5E
MAAKNVIFCSLMLSLLAWGIFDYILNVEENACEMTWMWERPMYLNVPGLPQKVKDKFPQYSLHLYGEGAYAKQSESMKLKGIPVLFIPGNAGSYRQVRSLGSVALRKAERSKHHFNYFVVNLNGELSGLYGGFLDRQTEYVSQCIKHILSLYKHSKYPPKSVILVGHSMGGIIARALFTLPDFDQSTVHTIITQATPHRAPVIEADIYIATFYNNVNQYWMMNQNSTLRDVTVLSVGGGERDILVRAGLTSTQSVLAEDRSVSAVTTGAPKVWASTDHLCVVWCRQLVLATKRAMFDIIDPATKQISTDADFKINVFRHHFDKHSGSSGPSTTGGKVNYPGPRWQVVLESRWNKPPEQLKPSAVTHFMLPLDGHRTKYDTVVVLTNVTGNSWISACTQTNGSKCMDGVDLSGKAELIPPLYTNYKVLHLSLSDIQEGVSHLVVTTPKLQRVDIKVEFYNSSERHIQFAAPNVFTAARTHTVIEETEPGQLFVNIGLQGFDQVHQAHTVTLTPLQCEESMDPVANTTMRMYVPWDREDLFAVSKATEVNVLSPRLQLNRPLDDDRLVLLHMYLNPQCRYKVELKASFQGCMGQMVRMYSLMIPSFVVINILMVLLRQLQLIAKNEYCHSFIYVQSDYNKPFKVVPPVLLIKMLLGTAFFGSLWQKLQLPLLDSYVLEHQGVGFGSLGLVTFLFAYAVVALLSNVITGMVKFVGTIILFLLRPKLDLTSATDSQSGAPWILYFIIGSMISIALRLCGTVSLAIGALLYFIKVARQHAAVVQTKNCLNLPSNKAKENGPADDENSPPPVPEALIAAQNAFHYHYTVLLLWLALLCLNVAPLIVWVKNLEYSANLKPDPSLYAAIIACVSLTVLLDPRQNLPAKRNRLPGFSRLILMSCIGLVAIGTISLYRVSYLIAAMLALLALLQL